MKEKKTYKAGIILGIIGLLFSLVVPAVTYGTSIPGLVLSVKKSGEKKTVCSFVLNTVAISLAFANSVLAVLITIKGYLKKHAEQF